MQEIAVEINKTFEPGPVMLLPGDTITVRFANHTDYNQDVEIRPDGTASFLKLGEKRCGGLTIPQLRDVLTQAYQPLISPEIDINIKSAAPRNVYVMGDVNDRGEQVLPDSGMTFLEALAKASGPIKSTAYMKGVLLLRWFAKEQRVMMWIIDAREENWAGDQRILLMPNDLIFVPNSTIDEIDIWVDNYIRRMIPIPFPTIPVTPI